jgi:hypothetical protein
MEEINFAQTAQVPVGVNGFPKGGVSLYYSTLTR